MAGSSGSGLSAPGTDLSGIGGPLQGPRHTGKQKTKHFTGKGHTPWPQEEHSEFLQSHAVAVRSDRSLSMFVNL